MTQISTPNEELNIKICHLTQKLKEKDDELLQAGRYGEYGDLVCSFLSFKRPFTMET